MIRVVIVDDEPLARDLLLAILSEIDDIEVVGVCHNGQEAVNAVMNFTPDVLFLDIEMPGLNGFDVINALQADIMPKVIFTTAFSNYAIKAFKVNALNYILKPLHEDAVNESLNRVRQTIPNLDKSTLLSALKGAEQAEYLALVAPEKTTIVDQDEIIWLEAAGDYVCVHLVSETRIIRRTLKAFMKDLPPKKFQRIHRSTIINIGHIKEMTPEKKGEATLLMSDSHHLKVSRSYGAILRTRLKNI